MDFQAAELDEISEGDQIQATLKELTGRGTVPQVFIKGQFLVHTDCVQLEPVSPTSHSQFQLVFTFTAGRL